ncbi:MAG: CoA-binding protein, partial [Planctomycetota bacterium]|nr:CoA-binding protein [Planctomycetota bacterium]
CVITPPEVTRSILHDAADLGLRRIWLQPGAEDPAVLELADHLGLSLISGGPCLLVVMGYHET